MHVIAEPCPSCGGFTIRPSHWRYQDLSFLLRFLRPLRCHSCGDRFYIRMFTRIGTVPQDEAEETKTAVDTDLVLRIRIKNPSRLTRALLAWAAGPPRESD